MSNPPVICVTGSRKWSDVGMLRLCLANVVGELGEPAKLWHGACPSGADPMADAWARDRGIQVGTWEADWAWFGRSAGPRRNAAMVAALPAGSVVVAFVPGSLAASFGTADCVRRALARGFRVRLVEHGGPGRWLEPAVTPSLFLD
jgi:hypothetical protein